MLKFVFVFLFIYSFAVSAFAELQVYPLRIVLSEKNRNAQVSLRHKGTQAMRYRISTIFYRMEQDGRMLEVQSPTEADRDGSKYFRFSPKQVILQPNVEQVVRMMIRLPADLPDGEYRCHLHFEGMEDVDSGVAASDKKNESQMSLKARLAVAIPVIIGKGKNLSSDVKLTEFSFRKGPQGEERFFVTMENAGNSFPYGDFEIFKIDSDGKETSVFMINGVSSYLAKRQVSYPVTSNLTPGRYKIIFKKQVAGGDPIVSLAEAVK